MRLKRRCRHVTSSTEADLTPCQLAEDDRPKMGTLLPAPHPAATAAAESYFAAPKNLPEVASITPTPLESPRLAPYITAHTSCRFLASQSSA
jgi:hypothetical protein